MFADMCLQTRIFERLPQLVTTTVEKYAKVSRLHVERVTHFFTFELFDVAQKNGHTFELRQGPKRLVHDAHRHLRIDPGVRRSSVPGPELTHLLRFWDFVGQNLAASSAIMINDLAG